MSIVTDEFAELPTVILFVVIASVWLLIALAIIWLGQRFVSSHVRWVSVNGVRNVLAVVASFYGFLIGFVVVQEWNNVSDAQEDVSQLAAHLATASFAAGTLPPPTAEKLINGLLTFGRSEVCDELPSLATATKQNDQTTDALEALYKQTADIRPTSVTALPGFGAFFGSLGNASIARREIVNASTERVPFVMMIAIVLAGLVLLVAVGLQDVRHGRAHVLAVVAVALFVALGQTVVVSLSRPFAGAATVSDEPLRAGVPPEFSSCDRPATLTDLRQLR